MEHFEVVSNYLILGIILQHCLICLKRPWCWARLRAGGEGDDRGWDGWVASLTRWTWVWASSGSWIWTGKPCVLQSMGSQRVRHDWVTKLNWTEPRYSLIETKILDDDRHRHLGRRSNLVWGVKTKLGQVSWKNYCLNFKIWRKTMCLRIRRVN